MATTLGLWLEVDGAKHVVGSQLERVQVDVMSVDLPVACG
jgi:hypothetical protein